MTPIQPQTMVIKEMTMKNFNQKITTKMSRFKKSMSLLFIMGLFAFSVNAQTYSSVINLVETSGNTNVSEAGTVLNFRAEVFNNGDTDLNPTSYTSVMFHTGALPLTGPTESGVTNGILEVGETWTFTSSYTVTAGDISSPPALFQNQFRIQYSETGTTTFLAIRTANISEDDYDEVTITVKSTATASLASNSPICSGENAVFTISGTAGHEVAYSGDATGTAIIGAGGTVDVTITSVTSDVTLVLNSVNDGSCDTAISDSETVTVNPLPATPVITGTDEICVGGTINDLATTATGTVTWTSSNTSVATINPTTGVLTAVAGGTTFIRYAVNDGTCNALSSPFEVTVNALPAVPTLSSTAASCSAAELTTITNYSASLTYTFSPAGPSVNASGEVTGATAGTAYTVTAGTADCTSSSASFTNDAMLITPAVPTLSSTAASCSAAELTTITNYSASLTYTFSPAGPSVNASGEVIGATAGTAYTVTAGTADCTSSSASFTNDAMLITPAVPTLSSTAASCSAAELTTITNYSASLTYTFSPAGPSVNASGEVTGATAGTAYTVTAGTADCTSSSASFTNDAMLITPAVPTLSSTAASCSAVELTTITNYSASLTYTFAPAGPSVNASGEVTGATAGTAYTVTAGTADCTSSSASFTNDAMLITPAVPTLSSTAASCSAVELTTITNYSASLTYTFAPAGPSVNASGEVTGATAGTAYTVTAGTADCTSSSASFTNDAMLITPAVPTLSSTAASCSAAELTTITNYSASLTYTFSPAGPSVNASGEVTGATAGTAYTVTAGTTDCTSSSASFTNDAMLITPAIPTLSSTAASCSAAELTTITNYSASLTYTFSPAGPSVNASGEVTGATAGTAYTVTAGTADCTSSSASFT
ncbi:hypothetical protein JBL43_18245, partial [Aureibaculum sp. A20]|nr:hypothetical protein [Aureibaculum flavum]